MSYYDLLSKLSAPKSPKVSMFTYHFFLTPKKVYREIPLQQSRHSSKAKHPMWMVWCKIRQMHLHWYYTCSTIQLAMENYANDSETMNVGQKKKKALLDQHMKQCKLAKDKRSQRGQRRDINQGKLLQEIWGDISRDVEVMVFTPTNLHKLLSSAQPLTNRN